MATPNEGGPDATAYSAGGAGGKFRKKTFRRGQHPTTPYDRPLTAQRGINNINNVSNDNGGLFTKLVLTPASKLISYGAHRFFASVFRKRLPPPQAPEVNDDSCDELQVAVPDLLNNQSGELKPRGGDNNQQLYSSMVDGISELELLLKQKTFSRAEIDHLTGLLQSRAAEELSARVDTQIIEETAVEFRSHKPFSNSPLEENIKGRDVSLGVMPTPISNSRVIENDIASPAQLAKAYMGTRSSKISPMHSQFGSENTGFLGNALLTSKSPNMSLTMKPPVSLGAPENGYVTPKSRGRSAIYNMARSRSSIHPFPVNKGIGLTKSLALVERNANFEAKPVALKRRSSVFDDDIGSVGPIRRIRQKPNLLSSRSLVTTRGGMENDPDRTPMSSKQKLPSIVEPKVRVSNLSEVNENDNVPRVHVPSKSSEVAARILQHLERLTPKEKSSESKMVMVREKSPFRLTQSMLRGQALKSMEDVDSSKLQVAVQGDLKLEDVSAATLPASRFSTFEKVEKNSRKESAGISDILDPVLNNGFVEKATVRSNGTSDSSVQNGLAQPLQTKRTFRMSAQEDSLEQDDDDESCYGISPRLFTEGREQAEGTLVGSKSSLPEELEIVKTSIQPKESEIVKTSIQPKVTLPLVHTNESKNPGVLMTGEGSGGIAFSLKKSNAGIQSEVLHPTILFGKPNGTNGSLSMLSSSSKTVDNALHLPSALSVEKPESKSENTVSLGDVSTAAGSQMKIPESEQGGSLKIGDANGKSHTLPSAVLNGPHVFRPPLVSAAAASPFEANQSLTTSSSLFMSTNNIFSFGSIRSGSTNTSSSTSMFTNNISSFGPISSSSSTNTSSSTGVVIFGSTNTNTSAASSGNPFGSNVVSSVFSGPVFNMTSAAPATSSKSEKEPNFGSSNGTLSSPASFIAANSGNSESGLGSSVSYSTADKGSLFGSSSKSSVSGFGIGSNSSNQFESSASLPLVNMNSNTSLGISLPTSQFNPNPSFGFISSASSASGQTALLSKYGTSSAVSDGNAVSSSSGAAPGMFTFGLGSSTSTSAAVSSNGITPPAFNFGGSSTATSVSNSAINSHSSSSAISNGFGLPSPSPSTGFSFGASSTTFAPTNASSMVFNSSTGSSTPVFAFAAASSPALSSSPNQPIFGSTPFGFAASPGNGDHMNAEDSMAEDPVQSSTPSIPIFGQPAVSPSPSGIMFGSTFPLQGNPFQFTGQQNQIPPPNPSPFQASGSLEFNAGGSFSLGSAGTDKSGRKFVKVNRSKNRKK